MTDAQKELLYDLLVKRIIEGLTPEEQQELETFDPEIVKVESRALETAAAAVSMASVDIEPLPGHLFSKIANEAPSVIRQKEAEFDGGATIPSMARIYTADDVFERKPRTFIFGLLGWIAAAILLIVLGVQFYDGRINNQPEKAIVGVPSPSLPATPDIAEQRDELLRNAPDVISATWSPGNMKDLKVSGDVIWSDSKQQGYVRLRGLPTNEASTTYQLWIFDKNQDEATPISGGTFDASSNGETILPIHAAVQAQKPQMFAVTLERHGGVMVSKRDKIAALAKVSTTSAS